MKHLTPVGISTYTRINHLKQTIGALQKNTLAKDTELYIFSDAPKNGDEEIVAKVREYIHTIKGFKEVHIVERKTNSRIANNRGGIQQLLDQYNVVIFLEDDILTAPGFLQFMNDALDFYKDDERILSISGYCPPLKIQKEDRDVFIIQRFSSWGFATWKDKFNPFGFELEQHGIEEFLKDKKAIKEFKKNGEDMYPLLLLNYNKEMDALDTKVMYYGYKYNLFTLYPVKSLVQNIGCDGSGRFCDIDDKFDHMALWEKVENFKFINDIQIDEKIRKINYYFWRFSIQHKLGNSSKYIGLYPVLKKIKDRIFPKPKTLERIYLYGNSDNKE